MNRRRRRVAMASMLVVATTAGSLVFWHYRGQEADPPEELRLYGNIDIRQVQVAFYDSGRIERLAVQEGDRVAKGQLLAEMDATRFAAAVAQARATVAQQQQILARLLAGSRPEEIAEARATVAGATANLRNAELTYRRQRDLARRKLVAPQTRDDAEQAREAARADLAAKQQALRLAVVGPRKEDIAAARAALEANEAALALAERELVDTRLYAPSDGVIQDRILEAGDMATPQTPVFTLALIHPVWVRAYLPETQLGRVQPGMQAFIQSDSFRGERFAGWVGAVSPTAEFTPKTVETTELRTQLVYQVRVYACNPDGRLRLGMPVTVVIPLQDNPPSVRDANPCGD